MGQIQGNLKKTKKKKKIGAMPCYFFAPDAYAG